MENEEGQLVIRLHKHLNKNYNENENENEMEVEDGEDSNVLYTFDQVIVERAEAEVVNPTGKRGRGRPPASGSSSNERTRMTKQNRIEVYFDMTNEISKVGYDNYQNICHSLHKDDWYCCVCFDFYNQETNPLYKCSRCGCIVHKYCYGIQEEPSDGWLCDYCQHVQDNQLMWKPKELV